MPTQELKDFVEERLRAANPDVDLSPGSPYETQVVDPIVRRFQPDPFEMTVEQFIQARLTQEFTDVNFREGSGIYDLLVKAAQVLLDPGSREVQLIKQSQSLANPELLSASEADALVANLFVSRATGGLSTGTVRLYFNAPVALNISIGNICYTADGLRFIPTTLQSISAEAMLFNQSGGLYYFDIQVTAEQAGTAYNIVAKQIVGITNLNAAVLVENPERFENGLDEESTEDLVQKAETSVTERSLVVARGVSARLYSQFEDLVQLQVVGMLDTEMQRDVITGGDLGPDLLHGVDGFTEDDGDGDAWTYNFLIRYGDFTSLFGSTGVVANKHYLLANPMLAGAGNCQVPAPRLNHIIITGAKFTDDDVGGLINIIGKVGGSPLAANEGICKILSITNPDEVEVDRIGAAEADLIWIVLRPPYQIEIDEVMTSQELKLKGVLPVDLSMFTWSIRQKQLTISDIPGGILYNDISANIVIQPDEVHIGGASDFFVRGTGVEKRDLVIPSILDEAPLARGLNMVADIARPEFVMAPGVDFVALGVKVGHSVVLETGVNAGTKTILRTGYLPSGGGGDAVNWLQITPAITSTDLAVRYKVINEIDINLREPRTIRGLGADLETFQLDTFVTTASAEDFLAAGAQSGDTLHIKEGNDKGKYTITGVSGMGNRDLLLSAQMKSTSSGLAWELYKASEGISFPLVRITSIDILDSSRQPTGYTIPYAPPIDARSTAFSNAGRGTKVSTNDAITGIVATTALDSLSYPITTTISLRLNGSAHTISLLGILNRNQLINTLNATIPNIAGYITINGKDYLTLRSGDRWLFLESGFGNTLLGFDFGGEDNRQIKSASNIMDWSAAAYDLKAQKDSVYIKTGDNTGFLYLVAVAPGKIYAVGVDEERGTLRFLQPNVGISVAVGSRSYGKARVYFMEPTSFTVRGSWHPPLKNTTTYPANKAIELAGATSGGDEAPVSYFTATVNGSKMRFFPDPDLNHQVLPAPEEDVPNNLTTDATVAVVSDPAPAGLLGKYSRAAAIDFLGREIRAGDMVDITFQPIQGDKDIRVFSGGFGIHYPTDIQGRTLTLSVGDNPPKTITFTDQLTGPDGVATAINDAIGETIAYIEDLSGDKRLRLEADFYIGVHGYSASPPVSTALPVFFVTPPTVLTDNYANADIDGLWTVAFVGLSSDLTAHYKLQLENRNVYPVGWPSSGQAQHFIVYRPGVQRLHSTDMNKNLENGLYYMDVELVSEGVGDQWNLDRDEVFDITGYESDGYRLTVDDASLSFSTEENLTLSISHRLLTVGRSDRPDEATPLSNQNIQVNYERSPLTSSIQSFASSELERVLNASILVRHLQPHYLNFELNYRGGSSTDVVQKDILAYLAELGPDDRVESSDLQNLALRRSATYVRNPITLMAVIHDENRKISVDKSEDYVTHGRLATFFPGTITVTRDTSTTL